MEEGDEDEAPGVGCNIDIGPPLSPCRGVQKKWSLRGKKISRSSREKEKEKRKTFRPGFPFLSVLRMRASRRRVFFVFLLLLLPLGRSPRSCLGYQGEEKRKRRLQWQKREEGEDATRRKRKDSSFISLFATPRTIKKKQPIFRPLLPSLLSVSPEPLKSITS